MTDSSPKEKRINPWTIWVPIIIMVLGIVVLYNYLIVQSLEKNKDRPPYITRLERDLDGLTERSGKQVRLGELKGKVMLLAHVYTSCPIGCSQIVAEMKDIYDEFTPTHPGLQFVSFAIDPDDNAERLHKYAAANDITKDNWWFVNGDQKMIRAYLTNVVKFYAVKEKPKDKQTSEVDKFEHDMRIALVDHAGHLRGMYDIMNPDPEFRDLAKKRLRKDLGYLLDDQEKETDKP
jgi:cytochrome oxidase Cu insertion factor (SCO1/SenC/PrrC family)